MARAVAPPPDNDDSSLEVTDIGATESVWTNHIYRIFLHCTSVMMLWCGHETPYHPAGGSDALQLLRQYIRDALLSRIKGIDTGAYTQ